jgi:hypothetical protein
VNLDYFSDRFFRRPYGFYMGREKYVCMLIKSEGIFEKS